MTAMKIYPETIWEYGRESYDYLYNHYIALKSFVSKAANEHMTIVVMHN